MAKSRNQLRHSTGRRGEGHSYMKRRLTELPGEVKDLHIGPLVIGYRRRREDVFVEQREALAELSRALEEAGFWRVPAYLCGLLERGVRWAEGVRRGRK